MEYTTLKKGLMDTSQLDYLQITLVTKLNLKALVLFWSMLLSFLRKGLYGYHKFVPPFGRLSQIRALAVYKWFELCLC
jgi:hypothetical protein